MGREIPRQLPPPNLYATTEFFDFLMRAGARFSEATGLKWEDVDFVCSKILCVSMNYVTASSQCVSLWA